MSCPRGCCATYREHISSLAISSGPTPQARRESRLSADLDAYQRLENNGLAPKTFAGAAGLERHALSPVEVERGHLIKNDRLRREVEQASQTSGAA